MSNDQHVSTGISWRPDDVPFESIPYLGVPAAVALYMSRLTRIVWNAAALEGNPLTRAEVKELVTSRAPAATDDEQQVLDLAYGFDLVGRLVGGKEFSWTKDMSDEIHGHIGRHEAIEAGHFRGEGSVTGGGIVRLSKGGVVPGSDPGPGSTHLKALFVRSTQFLRTLPDPREQALAYFASAVRAQFYFDANKRTARAMMNGILVSAGFAAIDIPAARHALLDSALDHVFETNDATDLLIVLALSSVR